MGVGLSVFNRAMLIPIDNVDHTIFPNIFSKKHGEHEEYPNVRKYRIPDMDFRRRSVKFGIHAK